MKKLLLIDSSALIYRFFHALPPLTTPEHDQIQAIYGLTSIILKIFSSPDRPECVAAAFDRPEKTFRKEKFQDYKSQRPPAPNELITQIRRMPEVFEIFGIKTFELPGYEADDILGTLSENFSSYSDVQTIILSGDLDVLQLVKGDRVVGEIIKTGVSDTVTYNEARVEERYGLKPNQLPDYKALIGDNSDNIPGVKGIGPKSALPLVKEFRTLENIYDNLAIITPAVAKKLADKKEIALLYRELTTIKKDVSIVMPKLEDLIIKAFDKDKLSAYFSKLGFTSLLKRI